MSVPETYLLRTRTQADGFRAQYKEIIEKNAPALEKWFNTLPLYEWVQYKPPAGKEMIVTGILCILYLEGRINLTFSSDMERIQRGARTDEEYQEWSRKHFGTR